MIRKSTAERYLQNSETEDCLDLVETMMRAFWLRHQSNTLNTVYFEAIENINYWLRYDNLGYEFNNGLLIRIDNIELHNEIIKPAFLFAVRSEVCWVPMRKCEKLLNFVETGIIKNAIAEANKAFESTMKSICIYQRIFS